MTGEISAAEVASSIQMPAIAGFNLPHQAVSAEVGPGGVVIVQTKANEADKQAAHAQNNRGNEKFADKYQKQAPVGRYSRMPIMAQRALAAHQHFNRLYAKYAPTLSHQPQMGQNTFERKKAKLWGAKDYAIRHFPLNNLATTSFACLSQSTRDRFNERAILNGSRTGPDGTFIDRRQPQQAGAANAQAMQPAPQPSPKVGMDRRQASRTATQNSRSPLMDAYARLAKSGLMLGTFDGPRYKGQA